MIIPWSFHSSLAFMLSFYSIEPNKIFIDKGKSFNISFYHVCNSLTISPVLMSISVSIRRGLTEFHINWNMNSIFRVSNSQTNIDSLLKLILSKRIFYDNTACNTIDCRNMALRMLSHCFCIKVICILLALSKNISSKFKISNLLRLLLNIYFNLLRLRQLAFFNHPNQPILIRRQHQHSLARNVFLLFSLHLPIHIQVMVRISWVHNLFKRNIVKLGLIVFFEQVPGMILFQPFEQLYCDDYFEVFFVEGVESLAGDSFEVDVFVDLALNIVPCSFVGVVGEGFVWALAVGFEHIVGLILCYECTWESFFLERVGYKYWVSLIC